MIEHFLDIRIQNACSGFVVVEKGFIVGRYDGNKDLLTRWDAAII